MKHSIHQPAAARAIVLVAIGALSACGDPAPKPTPARIDIEGSLHGRAGELLDPPLIVRLVDSANGGVARATIEVAIDNVLYRDELTCVLEPGNIN